MTPVGLSRQTVFAAIRVKYRSPPLIYPLFLSSLCEKDDLCWILCLPALLGIICVQVCLSLRYDLGFQRPGYGDMSGEKEEGNYESGCHDYD